MDVWFNGEEKKGVENMVNGYKGRREKQIEEKVNAAKKCPYCKQFFLHIIIQDVQTVGKSWKKHSRLCGELCRRRNAGSKLKVVY